MKPRRLAALWVIVAVLFVLLLLVEFFGWRSLTAEGVGAAAERQRLTDEIHLREEQLVAEMRGNSALLQEMQWTAAGGDPAAYLTRVADLAREKRMKVLGIGPLERVATPQFVKTWHAVQIQAPFREVRDLMGRVEGERGLVEDLHINVAPTPAGSPAVDEVQASFKMASLEISVQGKQIVERAFAAGGGSAQQAGAGSLALPVPARVAQLGPLPRDPFFFPAPAVSQRLPGDRGPVPPQPSRPAAKPPAPVDLKGIVSFPAGYLAIIDNQIVKVGDTVAGLRVERITEKAVTLREPGSNAPHIVPLPNLLGPAPPAPRR